MRFTFRTLLILLTLWLLGATSAFAAMAFPRIENQHKVKKILKEYPYYLTFVLAVGRQVDLEKSLQLQEMFEQLKSESPEKAALFLKELRIELIYLIQLKHVMLDQVHSHSPFMSVSVERNLPRWIRRMDELLFKVKALPVSMK